MGVTQLGQDDREGDHQDREQQQLPAACVAVHRRTVGAGSEGVHTSREGIVDIDALTGTPRFVGKTDGYLTGPSTQAPADIALGFIAANASVFALDPTAVNGLQLRKDYVSIDGTHHLFFLQTAPDGVPVFSNGIRANVTSRGELINFTGSPVASLGGTVGNARITATDAVVAAKQNV